ncbi:MAG: serpin family protein [Candidatus Zixiibacteriota bacterium]
MFKKILLISLAVVTAAGLYAQPIKENPDRRKPRPVPALPPSVFNNTFDYNLFRQIVAERPDENVFISPFSVSQALAMTCNGAAGVTLEEMRRVLGFEQLPDSAVNRAFAELAQKLPALDPDLKFTIANSVWYRQGLAFEENFLATNRANFNAEITGLDFSRPDAASLINDWVRTNTNGKITDIVAPPIDPMTVMYLVNAVYFKGTWTFPFDKNSQTAPFYISEGKETTCSLMNCKENFDYYENERMQIVNLPYSLGAFVMTVVLPRENVDINQLIAGLTDDTVAAWFDRMEKIEGRIYLPRFKQEFETSLIEPLEQLGMTAAFDATRADFSGIRPRKDLVISEVKHKTFIEVNEEGTEAAAATSVGIRVTAVMEPKNTFVMRCDHPFIYLIREESSGTVLFMGKLYRPEE